MDVEKTFRRIAVAANPQAEEALQEARNVADFLADRGVKVVCGHLDDASIYKPVQDGSIDLLIALGGDGTMLRAGHLCAPVNVPVIGINLGSLGFLTEIRKDHWRETLPGLFSDEVWFEHRLMLQAELWRKNDKVRTWEALNEVFVGVGAIKRPVHLSVRVDGHPISNYVADGVIVATPTGSTAYALAAGGPILPPELRNILIVPVTPHLAIDRAVVLAEGSSVEILIHVSHQGVCSVDGQEPAFLEDGDRVSVCASDHSARFAHLEDPAYFYRNLTGYLNRNPFTGAGSS